jgi:cell division protein FtsZ
LAEVTEAAETIQAAVDPDANIFFGAVIHPRAQEDVHITVIATGLKDGARAMPTRRAVPAEPPPPPPAREPEVRPRQSSVPTEWERSRPRTDPPRAPAPPEGDDHWDVPAFLRRPRR